MQIRLQIQFLSTTEIAPQYQTSMILNLLAEIWIKIRDDPRFLVTVDMLIIVLFLKDSNLQLRELSPKGLV